MTQGWAPGSVRVATVNLFARHGDWERRRPALAAALRELDADVLTLQEAVVDEDGDTARELLGDGYHLAHQRQGLVGDGSHRGSSVASRWPLRAVHEVDLHLTDRTWDYSCGTVLVEVDSPVGRLVVGSHGASWAWWAERERELQAVAVARAVDELVAEEPAHVVLGGDFNAEPHTSSMRFLTGRTSLDGVSTAYRDAWESVHAEAPGWTFHPRNPLSAIDEPHLDRGRRIDHVLVRCGDHGPTLRVLDAGLAVHEPVGGVQPSDHYGVFADLAPRTTAMPDTSAAGNPADR
ncbi:endonuclease/exonuclease/phosphatase family protein [Geodermatophilus sp. SYSU D00691]